MSTADFWIVGPLAEDLARALDDLPDGVRIRTAADFDAVGDAIADIRALAHMGHGLAEARSHMPRLEWLQTLYAGTDSLSTIDLAGVTVSTAAGAHVAQMSELAFLLLLGLARDVRGILADQAVRAWRPTARRPLAGSHVLIVGTGQIAQGMARRCAAFDMRVTGISATPRAIEGFDAIVAREQLAEAAAGADHLVILTSLTPETEGLVSRTVLEALPPRAVVINLGRGAVMDEAALVELLTAGRIAGAGLDVFVAEPLPADNPLWSLPNVIITPHSGGWSTMLIEQLAPIVRENVARWFGTPRRPLLNQQAGG